MNVEFQGHTTMAQEHTLWGIHAGKTGDAESLFEKHHVVAIGWKDVGDLSPLKTRDDFKVRYEETFPGMKPMNVAVSAGQLYRFVHEMKVGDAIVFPLKRAADIWLGDVTGSYEYNPKLDPGYPNTRKVKWLKKYPRTKFSQGALYEIGSAMSFFQVKNYADEFLAALEGKDFQPPTEEEEEEAIGLVADDIERQSHDFVLK